jgi:micrococcal nuclease
MKKLTVFTVIVSALCLLILAVFVTSSSAFYGKVVGVMDGDTVEVMRGGVAVRVRLDGIDCPEKRQAFGTRAKQFTSRAAFGKRVEVLDKGQDRYGRTLGEIILPDGSSLNQQLIAEGYAWWYWKYSDDQELKRLQAEAREAMKGLWSDPNVIPPWMFRQGGVRQAEDRPVEVLMDRGDVVFVTNTGSKYHLDGCRYLKKSKLPMALSEAKGRGYTPCSVCRL